jgi:hypothetical protein
MILFFCTLVEAFYKADKTIQLFRNPKNEEIWALKENGELFKLFYKNNMITVLYGNEKVDPATFNISFEMKTAEKPWFTKSVSDAVSIILNHNRNPLEVWKEAIATINELDPADFFYHYPEKRTKIDFFDYSVWLEKFYPDEFEQVKTETCLWIRSSVGRIFQVFESDNNYAKIIPSEECIDPRVAIDWHKYKIIFPLQDFFPIHRTQMTEFLICFDYLNNKTTELFKKRQHQNKIQESSFSAQDIEFYNSKMADEKIEKFYLNFRYIRKDPVRIEKTIKIGYPTNSTWKEFLYIMSSHEIFNSFFTFGYDENSILPLDSSTWDIFRCSPNITCYSFC